MFLNKIYKLVMQILVNLKIKWKGNDNITKPPVIEPPIVTPPLVETIFDLDNFLKDKEGIVRLPSSFDNKEIIIKSAGMIKPGKVKVLLGNNVKLTYENWNVTPTQQFDLSGCEEFAIVGVTFVCPPNRPIRTGFPDKELFGWAKDSVTKGKFALINSEYNDKDRVTFGLCRFAYSSNSNEDIHLIAKNVKHNGFNFTQIKNPYSGNLILTLQNVSIHNPIIEEPQSHYYSPTRVKVRVKIQNGIAKIISNNTFDQILTWIGYNNGNQRSVLHFDRYVYDISENKLIDNKTLKIDYQDELHPGDVTINGLVTEKQIDESRKSNWTYKYQQTAQPIKRTLPEGEFDAYIVYKGNALFSIPVTINTKFGEGYWESGVITISQGYGWSWYNESFSGYIENFNGTGFYRNSTGGVTKGLTIINSKFEKNAPVATSNNPMSPIAKSYIEYLEKL